MVQRLHKNIDVDGRPSKSTAFIHPHQNYRKETHPMDADDDRYEYQLVKCRVGRSDQVVEKVPISCRFYGAARQLAKDERAMTDIVPDTDDHNDENVAVAGSSNLGLRHTVRRHTQSILLPGAARDYEESETKVQQYPNDDETGYHDDAPGPKVTRMESFKMNETDKVKAYLTSCIEQLQQLSDKRISKAWIKAICPRKQANFPYQTKKREANPKDEIKVPGWWPNTDVCPFKEPDHVKKHQRNALMLHLLRLRPGPGELKRMNGDNCEPLHYIGRWTEFLEDVAPAKILDGLEPTNRVRQDKRRQLLGQIYDVARMEEAYVDSGQNEQYQYEPDVKIQNTVTGKRSRRAASVSSSQDADGDETDTRSSAAGRSKRAIKAQRRRSRGTSRQYPSRLVDEKPAVTNEIHEEDDSSIEDGPPADEDTHPRVDEKQPYGETAMDMKPVMTSTSAVVMSAGSNLAYRSVPQRQLSYHQPVPRRQSTATQLPQNVSPQYWQPPHVSPNASFTSSSTETEPTIDPYPVFHYPGQLEYPFTVYPTQHQPQQQQKQLQVYPVGGLPQPHFDTVPNTPDISAMDWVNHALPQQHTMTVMPMDHSVYNMPYIQPSAATQGLPYAHQMGQQIVAPDAMQHIAHGMPAAHPHQRSACTRTNSLPATYDGHAVAMQYPYSDYRMQP